MTSSSTTPETCPITIWLEHCFTFWSNWRQSHTNFNLCPKWISTFFSRVCSRHRCSLIQKTLLTRLLISSAMSSFQSLTSSCHFELLIASAVAVTPIVLLSQKATNAKRYRSRLQRNWKKTRDVPHIRLAGYSWISGCFYYPDPVPEPDSCLK